MIKNLYFLHGRECSRRKFWNDFEKETGVKVVYSNFDTDETMLEKLSMAKGGDYDICNRR